MPAVAEALDACPASHSNRARAELAHLAHVVKSVTWFAGTRGSDTGSGLQDPCPCKVCMLPSAEGPARWQIRQALAIAGALGRALIIPELWCGADRYWAPHGGVIPGAALRLPFQCPTDHVLDLEQCAPLAAH